MREEESNQDEKEDGNGGRFVNNSFRSEADDRDDFAREFHLLQKEKKLAWRKRETENVERREEKRGSQMCRERSDIFNKRREDGPLCRRLKRRSTRTQR